MERRVEALVVGGGLAGLSAAYFLARRGLRSWVLEREAPLSCTSDKSTEAYRLFWPGDEDLAALVRESLDLLSPFAGVARPNRRGYLYVGRLEALAAWATGEEPPPWALAFAPGRFLDPSYRLKGEAARFQL